MTREQYMVDKTELERLNRAIDEAPMERKPVFPGIVRLHNRVKRYEKENSDRSDA